MRCRSSPARLQPGFTVIELITVIVLLGVLSIVAAPRLLDTAALHSRGFQEETVSFLRYAQKAAIAQRRVVCLAFTRNSATLHISAAPALATCDTPLRGPLGDSPGTLTATSGEGYRDVPTDFNFDALGQPVDATGLSVASQTLHVDGLGGAVTVETGTGYVHE